MVMKKSRLTLVVIIALIGISIFVVGGLSFNSSYQEKSFSLKGTSVQLNLPVGNEASTNNIKIINNLKKEQTFYLSFENLNEIAFLEQKEFSLGPGEEKDITLLFNDSFGKVNVYAGKFVVSNSKAKKEMPIIINVIDERNPFSIIQTPLSPSSYIYPGEDFTLEIKLVDSSNSEIESVKMIYSLINFEGDVLEKTESDIIVGDSWTKIISIPKDFTKGNYVFVASMEYQGVKTNSAYKFFVRNDEFFSFLEDLDSSIILVLIFVLILFVLFIYFIHSRDKLLMSLKKQQTQELNKNLELIKDIRFKSSKIKDKKKREKHLKKLEKAKKRVIKRIRKKQEKQKKELRNLRRGKKKKSEIQKKMEDWKKQGYKMEESSEEMSLPKKEINKQVKNWKKQGYKI